MAEASTVTDQHRRCGSRLSTHVPVRFRGDIQGLRAIAVGLVLIYHAGVPFLPGGYVGVDVFFVVSGFLITTMLVSELDQTGRISLRRFYARRAKRLLPAAAVVLTATVGLVVLCIPKVRWSEIGGDIISASVYVVNWRLAARTTDYLAEDSAPSPVQHFWSLAVEEQYYLAWPLLLIVAAFGARLTRTRVRAALWVSLAAVAVPSFAWSLIETAYAPERAFFLTTTRGWELGVGAAVALAAAHCARIPRAWAAAIGWVGLASIVLAALIFTAGTSWPGHSAALPTLATAAVIVAGCGGSRGGPEAVLDTRPFRWVGALSYSLYLWHWPLVVAATAYWDGLTLPQRLAVVGLSVVPAWLTFRLVENPARHAPAIAGSPRLAFGLAAGCTVAGVTAGLVLPLTVASSVVANRGDERSARGAGVLAADPRDDPGGAAPDHVRVITPDPLQATSDVPDVYGDGCHQDQRSAEILSCTYGNPDATVTVAVAGDSKIAQWLPALQVLAGQNNWKLVTYTKSACSFAAADILTSRGTPYTSCARWNAGLLDHLRALRPQYLLTSQGSRTALSAAGAPSVDAMVDGLRKTWSALTAVGSRVIVLADNPHPGMNVYQCVDQHREDLTACTYSRDRRTAHSAYVTQKRAVRGQAGVAMIDLYDAVCPTAECSPVIGNVLVYRQGAHITATYVRTLTPRLAAALSGAGLPADFDGKATRP
jgi:peptidoglycan/LPS O-acetylase OafA/YrhL